MQRSVWSQISASVTVFVILCTGNVFGETVHLGSCILAYGSSCKEVKMYLITRANEDAPQTVTLSNISASHFDPSLPTKLYAHGYASDPDLAQLVRLRKAWLAEAAVNVLAVDYSELVPSCYPFAVRNARYAATCLSNFLRGMVAQNLIKTQSNDTTPETILELHAVGFSLGGQLVGLLADRLRPDYILKRISGLDPALPLFVTSNLAEKLDSTDAVRVDVVHSNCFFNGKAERCGHADFYVNGGVTQPGCDGQGILNEVNCAHVRSVEYFVESIRTNVGFYGWVCESIEALQEDRCPSEGDAVLMGEHWIQTTEGSFAVKTRTSPPYAAGPFWVTNSSMIADLAEVKSVVRVRREARRGGGGGGGRGHHGGSVRHNTRTAGHSSTYHAARQGPWSPSS